MCYQLPGMHMLTCVLPPSLVLAGRMDMIERKTYDEICHIMDVGYQYAAQLHATGHFDHMELGEMMLDHLEAAERV